MSVIIYDVFENQEKLQKFDVDNEGQAQDGDKLDIRRSIENY